jgi:hypothetical protein
MKGAVTIATTNHLYEIKQMYPVLFRHEWLTPNYFDYIKKDLFREISKFYFNKELAIYIPDQLKIPINQIIQFAIETITYDQLSSDLEKIKYFQGEIDKIL